MASAREEAEKRYGHRYQRFYHDLEARFTCFYCGDPAECFDHVPPICRVSDYESFGLAHPRYLKVPACHECNTLAGSEVQESILERNEVVKAALRRKHRRVLASPEWDADDFANAALRGRLRHYVKSRTNRVSTILARLDYSLGVQRYCDEFDPIDFPRKGLLDEE